VKLSIFRATRAALLVASSGSALAFSSPALAASASTNAYRIDGSEALRAMVASAMKPTLRIITNDGPDITPGTGVSDGNGGIIPGSDYANSADVLDTSGVNGVGQMLSISLPFLNLCTGTLINPRTVITAAHCVYEAPKQYYGSNTGVGGGISPSDKSGLIPPRVFRSASVSNPPTVAGAWP